MKETNQFTIVTEDGSETLVTILFTFEKNDKNYVVFEYDAEDDKEISAAIYQPSEDEKEGTLIEIEDDAEWDMVDDMLEKFYQDQEDEQ